MPKLRLIAYFFLLFLFASCSSGKEVLMPFKNYGYSSSRIFPIQKNDTEFSFRVWMSLSTSVDRIISVSRDSSWNDQGKLVEFGFLSKGKKRMMRYIEKEIAPRSGFHEFVRKVDSLALMSYKDQEEEVPMALHQPISLFIVEVKKGDSYNCFRFNSLIPPDTSSASPYKGVEDLILSEFDIFD